MSISSLDPASTIPAADRGTRAAASMIHQRVRDMAVTSTDRREFYQLLAADLQDHFGAVIVAIEASHLPEPLLRVADDAQSNPIEPETMTELLRGAAAMPIACDVAIGESSEPDMARGIRVELLSVPERTAVLLIYPPQQRPSAMTQIADLKELGQYADAARSILSQVPIATGPDLAFAQTELADPLASQSLQLHRSLRLFHLDLDLSATSNRIANESRRLLDCDRTTILVPKFGRSGEDAQKNSSARYRAAAVSGVSVVDSRSNSVRAIERLANAAIVMSRPLLLPGDEPLPPQIQDPLDEYLDESDVMSAVLLPLRAPERSDDLEGLDAGELDPFHSRGEIVGVMVLEYFSGRAPVTLGPLMTLVASEATLSLRNSLEHQQVFGLRVLKPIGKLIHSRRMPLVIAALVMAAVLVLASMLIQVEHYVVATGNVEPAMQREVFATVDGTVKKLHVNDGEAVREGDLLMELENAELESRAESLSGEIQTAIKRLASIRTVRLSHEREAGRSSHLILEQRQLESELQNLWAQQAIVKSQQEKLLVRSPIDGTVIGWQLKRRLKDRPVTRGNLLVSVADHSGPWSLRLRVPDRDAGPVLSAAKVDGNLAVRFAVATRPEASFAATIDSLGTAARLDELGNHVIDATARVASGHLGETVEGQRETSDAAGHDRFVPGDTRAGADVTAKIACGKRSVLRSWFGDVFDFVHRNILFYF